MQFRFIPIIAMLIIGLVNAQASNSTNANHSLPVLPPPALNSQQVFPSPSIAPIQNSTNTTTNVAPPTTVQVPISHASPVDPAAPSNPLQSLINGIASFFSRLFA